MNWTIISGLLPVESWPRGLDTTSSWRKIQRHVWCCRVSLISNATGEAFMFCELCCNRHESGNLIFITWSQKLNRKIAKGGLFQMMKWSWQLKRMHSQVSHVSSLHCNDFLLAAPTIRSQKVIMKCMCWSIRLADVLYEYVLPKKKEKKTKNCWMKARRTGKVILYGARYLRMSSFTFPEK